jgi:hypothetical protein
MIRGLFVILSVSCLAWSHKGHDHSHDTCKEGCPDIKSVVKGPIPDNELGVEHYTLACKPHKEQPAKDEISCHRFTIKKYDNITGDAYKFCSSYKNITSGELQNQTFYVKVSVDHPDQYITVDEQGHAIDEHKVVKMIYKDEKYEVIYGCLPKEGDDHSLCLNFYQINGFQRELPEADLKLIKEKLKGYGLETEKGFHLVNQKDCPQDVPKPESSTVVA